MKKKIIKWLNFSDTINERNSKFECKWCGEVYGKKVKQALLYKTFNTICIKCLVKKYGKLIKICKHGKKHKEVEKILSKALKEIKKDYEIDLIDLEL